MHLIDWLVVRRLSRLDRLGRSSENAPTDDLDGYFLANRSLPWWAVGLSVMATQLSAITLVGATGQGYADGMRFVQFYFGLPIAMIILSLTLVPFFYRARVYTAYEYLEKRFDAKTRTLASVLFLLSRGMSCGVIIAAPAVILSIVLDWNLTLTIMAIGLPTALYTIVGGVQAVTWTDVKQMVVIIAGVVAAVIALIVGLPDDVSVGGALQVAGAAGRLNTIDFTFRLDADLHVLVGPARRLVPDAVVFRLRSEPGAALPDGEVDRRGPSVAADERVLQDPSAGTRAAHRRAGLCLLPVQSAAHAVQRQACRRRLRRAHARRSISSSRRSSRRPSPASGRLGDLRRSRCGRGWCRARGIPSRPTRA